MAQKPQKAQSNPPAQRLDKRRPPDFVCRARKMDQFGRPTRFYQHIGVAWAIQIEDKKTGEIGDGFAVKLEAMPTQFDGSFVMLKPKPKANAEPDAELEEQH